MKKLYISLTCCAIILAILLLFPNQTYAASGDIYDVGQTNLNVRSEPSIDAEIIGKLQVGEQVVEFQEKHGWVQTYYGGKEAWVAKQYLLKSKQMNHLQPKTRKKSTTAITKSEQPQVANSHTTESSALNGYNIMLDPGHGGNDPGSIGVDGMEEKILTLATTHEIAKQLESIGANVLLTRSKDEYVSLEDRVAISKAYLTHVFISVHYNAFADASAQGLNTFYYSNADKELAKHVHRNLTSKVNLQDRGVVQKNYYVLRNNTAPAILLELGFITNPDDIRIIQTNQFKREVAEGITNGLQHYFQSH
ncbi:N-acetylmuramoyl-L-alanine amidase [Cerasibacillus sp. JNUCC 74]